MPTDQLALEEIDPSQPDQAHFRRCAYVIIRSIKCNLFNTKVRILNNMFFKYGPLISEYTPHD